MGSCEEPVSGLQADGAMRAGQDWNAEPGLRANLYFWKNLLSWPDGIHTLPIDFSDYCYGDHSCPL